MERLIDPQVLARVKDLPLIAKTVAEGFLFGLQSSMQRGVGIEFSQYRAYETGDELSRIDWKLFARSDRYFVREAERESEIDIWFLLDCSASMAQASRSNDATQSRLDKLNFAKILIASIAYLAQKQGDSIGLMSMDSSETKCFTCANGLKQWQKILLALDKIEPAGGFPRFDDIKKQFDKINRPSIIFVLSDFAQKTDEIIELLGKLNTTSSEVVALSLFCEDEEKFDYRGPIQFKDLETQETVLVNPSSAKQRYFHARANYINRVESALNEKNIKLHQFNIDQPLDLALYEYLKTRQRMVR